MPDLNQMYVKPVIDMVLVSHVRCQMLHLRKCEDEPCGKAAAFNLEHQGFEGIKGKNLQKISVEKTSSCTGAAKRWVIPIALEKGGLGERL